MIGVFGGQAVLACQLALVLAVDVSGSVDKHEYRIQMEGLSAALRDGIVIDALLEQEAMITLIQWTGSSRQRQTIPWTEVRVAEDVARLADDIAANSRVWRTYSTAIGEALIAAEQALMRYRTARARVSMCQATVFRMKARHQSRANLR